VLPAAIRETDHLAPGDVFSVKRLDDGEYKLSRIATSNEGLVDLLLACPEKDFFVPVASELTNEI
jgi:hypothetical protein